MDDDFDGAEVRVEDSAAAAAAAAALPADTTSKRKRKRAKEKAHKATGAPAPTSTSPDAPSPSPASKRPRPAPTTTDPALAPTIDPTISQLPPALLADYVGARHQHWNRALSSVELLDSFLPARLFGDTTHWQAQRSLANLPNYLEKCCRVEGAKKFRLDQAAQVCGAPHTLVVTGAALRASRVAGALRKYQSKDAMVAKLFAKHIKVKESVEMCKNNRIGVAVGTPARILEVLGEGVLQLQELRWIVVDASHVDQKGFNLFGIREVQKGLMELFGHEATKKRFEEGLKILFF